jgi:hypothetical protein
MNHKKIKLLYIGFNRSYINPTAELYLRVLGQICDLKYYGPGFSDNFELDAGIDKWINDQEPFDFITIDSYILECDSIVQRKKPFAADFIRFNVDLFYKYSKSYMSFFLNYKGNKIFIANFDTYSVEKTVIDRIILSDSFVIDGGISSNKPKLLVESIYGESCIGNDNWYNFVNTFKHKIITLPHFISSSEFDFSPLQKRKYNFNVIGAPYQERKSAYNFLPIYLKLKKIINIYKNGFLFRLNSSLTENRLQLIRNQYFQGISNSKLCYCSGGPWMSPVRKYFEIPARGSVAIGMKCNGFDDFGFVNGVNFIEAKTNTDISKILSNIDILELQKIANAGRDLVWEFHSDFARVKQLNESLTLIKNNNFKGSYWHFGKYLHY